jgi:hypothetical protein
MLFWGKARGDMKIEFLSEKEYELSGFHFRILPGIRFVVFDVEATGPDPFTESVTQMGAVVLDGPEHRQSASFTNLVKPWKAIRLAGCRQSPYQALRPASNLGDS